jgi:4-amino-4-deoxy-L-arabinose transferase-like glycosyltransferase
MALVKKSVASNPAAPRPNPLLPPWWAALILFVGTALLLCVRLGHLDFWAPDEPRYGAIAEELRSFRHGTSGLVLLHLNDAPYTQKPPLYFWLAALAGIPGDRVTEWAARLPSAVAGFGGVLLTTWIGRRLLGNPMLALLAGGLLATSFRFVFTARRAQLDVLLTCFELIAIAIFVAIEFRRRATTDAFEDTHAANSSADTFAAPSAPAIATLHAALGAAALVKGPVGWLPLAIFAAYLAWEGRLRTFLDFVPLWALSLSILPVCVWIAAAISLAPAGFAEIAVGENLIGRFFSGTAHARPFYYYLLQTPADFLPWTLLLPFGFPPIWRWARRASGVDESNARQVAGSPARFIIAWIALPLLFFSLSAGKRGVYLLPVFPALALVAGVGLRGAFGQGRIGKIDHGPMRRGAIALAIVASIELVVFAFGLPRLEAEKSPRPIAESAARATRPDEAVGVFALQPIEGAIAYYGDRRVTSLEDTEALRSFLDAGGQVVLLRERHFDEFRHGLLLDRLANFRSGRRRLVLANRRPQPLNPQGESIAPMARPSARGARKKR